MQYQAAVRARVGVMVGMNIKNITQQLLPYLLRVPHSPAIITQFATLAGRTQAIYPAYAQGHKSRVHTGVQGGRACGQAQHMALCCINRVRQRLVHTGLTQ